MPKIQCECGARYRFTEDQAGKRSKCKKCGAILTLAIDDAGAIPFADEPFSNADDPAPAPSPAQFSPPAVNSGLPTVAAPDARTSFTQASPGAGYWEDLLWTFLFITNPGNVISFLIVWLMMGLGPLIPFVGRLVALMAAFWYAAWRFEIITSSAAGEDDLPDVAWGGDIVGELIIPGIKWVGSVVLVLIPAIGLAMYRVNTGAGPKVDLLLDFAGGSSGTLEAIRQEPLLSGLAAVGLLFWPLVLLCIALGGMHASYRVDLMLRTVVRTPMAYLVTVAIVFGSQIGGSLLASLVTEQTAKPQGRAFGTGFVGQYVFIHVVTVFIHVYLGIVAARAIGLYYYHFKRRFAWDWG